MSVSNLHTVISGNQQAVSQCQELLHSLTDTQYCVISQPYARSSIGQHIRHVLDVYHALFNGISAIGTSVADYDQRRRGAPVESDKERAITEFSTISEKLVHLLSLPEQEAVVIQTEVCLESSDTVEVKSSLVRELVFTASHAVHHFALIAMLARIQGIDVDTRLGVAPATASFLRDTAEATSLAAKMG